MAIPADVARMFVAAWEWSVSTKAHPDQAGPVATHNRLMLAACRAALAPPKGTA